MAGTGTSRCSLDCWARGQRRCLVCCHGVSNGGYRSVHVSVRQEDDVPTEDPKTGIVALPATESSLADERTSFLQAVSALALLG